MKPKKRVEFAIIGGSGLEKLLNGADEAVIGTPYGLPPPITIGEIGSITVAFLPRHGKNHEIPPHRINHKANVYALHELGVKCIAATNAVGAINTSFKPGDLVIPHDFIDLAGTAAATFYDEPVTHVDFSEPYCPQMRTALARAAHAHNAKVHTSAVLACTAGPRFETPAEIRMLRTLGADVVGMTGAPEAVLSRELEICYASLCYVSNMAAGIQKRLSVNEVRTVSARIAPVVAEILRDSFGFLPKSRECVCRSALKNARFKG